MRRGWLLLAIVLLTAPFTGVSAAQGSGDDGPIPHVVVAVPDSGINPYHEAFYKPDDPRLDEHPCTYIPDFPCSVERLDLSLQLAQDQGYAAALEADEDVWEDQVHSGQWYWIPQTPFVAVYCQPPSERSTGPTGSGSSTCILDDGTEHGTGTTYSVVDENEDALIAFKQGGSSIQHFIDGGIPVDVYSVSWGYAAPLPLPHRAPGIYVKAAGNDPRSAMVDGWSGNPEAITVGGGYKTHDRAFRVRLADGEEEALATKQPDIVGPYCRQTAQPDSVSGFHRQCGTSFSAPTAAGALSKVILTVREHTGYTGNLANGFVDKKLGLTQHELRTAMNRTASYDPPGGGSGGISAGFVTGVPLNPVAPWLQWGWGFYNGLVAEDTIQQLIGAEQPRKPELARTYMYTLYEARQIYDTNQTRFAPNAQMQVACDGLDCHFDASESHDQQTPDDELNYTWNLGDGTTLDGRKVQHTYEAAGSYEVVLEVSDADYTDTTNETVFALPQAELTATPTKENFDVDEPVRIQLDLKAKASGDGIGGVPVVVETTYTSGNDLADGFIAAPITKDVGRQADVAHHRVEATTDADGEAVVTIPSETRGLGPHTNLPTPTGEHIVRAELAPDDVFVVDDARYTVGPTVG